MGSSGKKHDCIFHFSLFIFHFNLWLFNFPDLQSGFSSWEFKIKKNKQFDSAHCGYPGNGFGGDRVMPLRGYDEIKHEVKINIPGFRKHNVSQKQMPGADRARPNGRGQMNNSLTTKPYILFPILRIS